jgi:hypothetical protein
MLATLGGGALMDTLGAPAKTAQPPQVADAQQPVPAVQQAESADDSGDDRDEVAPSEAAASDADQPDDAQPTAEAADGQGDDAEGVDTDGESSSYGSDESSYYQRSAASDKVGATRR